MIIAPSIFNANILNLLNDINLAKEAGAKYLHIDIMDGHFVPNLSFGTNILGNLKNSCDLTLDCHLMVENPENMVNDFANEGADIITVHVESTRHIYRTIQIIKERGILAGIAINPGTPVENVKEVLSMVDQILVMTINPGTKGQKFIPSTVDKIRYFADLKRENNQYNYKIEVDGNITDETIKDCIEAGADVFVSGNYIFGSNDIKNRIQKLMKAGVKDEC